MIIYSQYEAQNLGKQIIYDLHVKITDGTWKATWKAMLFDCVQKLR